MVQEIPQTFKGYTVKFVILGKALRGRVKYKLIFSFIFKRGENAQALLLLTLTFLVNVMQSKQINTKKYIHVGFSLQLKNTGICAITESEYCAFSPFYQQKYIMVNR